jgi:hypothetical protein
MTIHQRGESSRINGMHNYQADERLAITRAGIIRIDTINKENTI